MTIKKEIHRNYPLQKTCQKYCQSKPNDYKNTQPEPIFFECFQNCIEKFLKQTLSQK